MPDILPFMPRTQSGAKATFSPAAQTAFDDALVLRLWERERDLLKAAVTCMEELSSNLRRRSNGKSPLLPANTDHTD